MTAEELLKGDENHLAGDYTPTEVISTMIEFASYHVQKALEAASVKVNGKIIINPRKRVNEIVTRIDEPEQIIEINKDSILNSYPLTNIK